MINDVVKYKAGTESTGVPLNALSSGMASLMRVR